MRPALADPARRLRRSGGLLGTRDPSSRHLGDFALEVQG